MTVDNQASARRSSPRWALLRFVVRENRGASALLGLEIAVAAMLPVAIAVGVGLLVGSIPAAVDGGLDSAAFRRSVLWLAVVSGVFLIQQCLPPLQEALAETLGVRVTARLGDRVMRAALRPAGISHLEDPNMLDRIARAQSLAPTDYAPLYAVPALAGIVVTTAAAVTAAAVTAAFAWWAPVLLLGARFVSRAVGRRQLFRISEAATGQTRALRRAKYLRELAVTPEAAKELRVFGLAGWLTGRFTDAWHRAMHEVWQRRGRSGRVLAAALLAPLVADLLVLGSLTSAFVAGELSLGRFVTFAQAVVGMAGLALLSTQDMYAEYGSRPAPAALELEEAVGQLPGPGTGAPVASRPSTAIRFADIRFRYPGATADVLSGLDFTVPAGRSIAVVGANGAGKTTLVKLLAGLYEPSGGRIEVDGTDLRELDPRGWQRTVAAIFQDFVHYDLSLRDNITLGAPHVAGDDDLLMEVARRAGVLPVLEQLPHGWDTVLNRLHSKGAELSGGQWQRVAIARALFAVAGGARMLVLDEPTANLDVRAEAEIYTEFLNLTSGVTTVLISHRFATVRQADRICVLDGGRITEIGDHDELMDRDGRYAEMFRLQANAFGDAAAKEVVS